MNTDKIYAESIAKEYAPKDHSKIVALRKLDGKAKTPAAVFAYVSFPACWQVLECALPCKSLEAALP